MLRLICVHPLTDPSVIEKECVLVVNVYEWEWNVLYPYYWVGYNSSVTDITQTQINTFEFSVCCSVNYDLILCAGEAQSETSRPVT